MITPWEIYWVLQLDSINGALMLVAFLSTVVAIIFLGVSFSFDSESPDDYGSDQLKAAAARHNEKAPVLLKVFFRLLIFAVTPSFVLSVLLPSTRTAAAMIVAPKIINSPTVQHEAGDLYKLAKQALERAVEPEPEKRP